jgi:hypothetical protein
LVAMFCFRWFCQSWKFKLLFVIVSSLPSCHTWTCYQNCYQDVASCTASLYALL